MTLPDIILQQIQSKNLPRKRSKVSRACDACRNRKMRCNADFSQSLNCVTKPCDRCTKHDMSCTFSRVPLKRGPLKGFQRDDGSQDPRLLSFEGQTPIKSSSHQHKPSSISSLLNQNVISLPLPQISLFDSSSSNLHSASGSQSPYQWNTSLPKVPIILPPLGSAPFPQISLVNSHVLPHDLFESKTILNQHSSAEVPPAGASPFGSASVLHLRVISSPVINQVPGPLWKVPYEMPVLNNSSMVGSFGRNRSTSLDSTLSSVSFSSARYTNHSTASDLAFESDPDEYFSLRPDSSASRKFSGESVEKSSLRIYITSTWPPMPHSSPSFFDREERPKTKEKPVFSLFRGLNSTNVTTQEILGSELEKNVRIYYIHTHPSFPILYFSEEKTLSVLRTSHSLLKKELCDLLNFSLRTLIRFKDIPLHEKILILLKLLGLYKPDVIADQDLIFILSSALLIVNYAIFLNGDRYSLGMAALIAILHEYQVVEELEKCLVYDSKHDIKRDFDSRVSTLGRHCFCLAILCDLYALLYGVQQSIDTSSGKMGRLTQNIDQLLPLQRHKFSVLALNLFLSYRMIRDALSRREVFVSSNTDCTLSDEFPNDDLSLHFSSLVTIKHQLLMYMRDLLRMTSASSGAANPACFVELFHDNFAKLLRILHLMLIMVRKIRELLISSHEQCRHPLHNISISQIYGLLQIIYGILVHTESLCAMKELENSSSLHEFKDRCQNLMQDTLREASNLTSTDFSPWLGVAAFAVICHSQGRTSWNSQVTDRANSNQNTMNNRLLFLLKQVILVFEDEWSKGWI